MRKLAGWSSSLVVELTRTSDLGQSKSRRFVEMLNPQYLSLGEFLHRTAVLGVASCLPWSQLFCLPPRWVKFVHDVQIQVQSRSGGSNSFILVHDLILFVTSDKLLQCIAQISKRARYTSCTSCEGRRHR